MRHLRLGFMIATIVFAHGCAAAPTNFVVKGKLTNGGASVLSDKRGGLTMIFVPAGNPGAAANTYPAAFKKDDDTYEVTGPDGKGIPPGKYKVTLNVMLPTTTPAAEKINDQYSLIKSPIEVDVT